MGSGSAMNKMGAAARGKADAAAETGVKLGRLGEYVGFRLRRVQNQLSRDFVNATANRGLRSGLFSSLALISANPGISQSELSREIAMDKSVTVSLLDDLEQRGWAVRKRSTKDRRRHALHITPEGERELEEIFAVVSTTENAVLHQLSPAELMLLSELLDRMYAVCVREE
jgi:DNA-binding MarR family transcriptional regulator